MSGGGNFKHHPETIKKMSESLKGRVYGRPSEETIQKIRESHLGEKNPNFGKKMSDEQKKKISETLKKNYKEDKNSQNISDQGRINQLKALEKGRFKKRVGKYDTEGNLLEIYNSTVEAGNKCNIHWSVIGKVCRQVPSYKTAGGFVWKYLPKD